MTFSLIEFLKNILVTLFIMKVNDDWVLKAPK